MKEYRFIELPIIVYNGKEQEITNKRAEHIESYQESIPLSDFREDNKIWTDVFMDIGDTFIVNMPLAEFEKLLINHLEDLSNQHLTA